MNINKIFTVFFALIISVLPIWSMEIDQLTDREIYCESITDFTKTLNNYTNSLLIQAVDNYNRLFSTTRMTQREIHDQLAFEIYKLTAGNYTDSPGSPIPDRVNLIYALGKSSTGTIQDWIIGKANSDYWYCSTENLYSNIVPHAYNKNFVIKVGAELIGPDKIDHFFDQGYSYWTKSEYGTNDMAAKKFGVESEYGWYGILSAGVFSFADLRANWAGYQFYKFLFNGEKAHFLISVDGIVTILRPFDWAEHVDWQFDELKNPSIYTNLNKRRMARHLYNNYDQYKKTYLYLKEHDFFKWFDKRESFYLIEGITFDKNDFFDPKEYLLTLQSQEN